MGSKDDDGVGACVEDDEPTGSMKRMMMRGVVLVFCVFLSLTKLYLAFRMDY